MIHRIHKLYYLLLLSEIQKRNPVPSFENFLCVERKESESNNIGSGWVQDLTFVNHDAGARRTSTAWKGKRGSWTSKLMQIDVSARYRLHPVAVVSLCPSSSPFAFPAHDAQFSLIQGQSIAKLEASGCLSYNPPRNTFRIGSRLPRRPDIPVYAFLLSRTNLPLSLSLFLSCLLFTDGWFSIRNG